jgi:hypothetical protein
MDANDSARELTDAERRAVEYGIDLSLIDENLRLTPLERLKKHEAFWAKVMMVQRALAKRYESFPSSCVG